MEDFFFFISCFRISKLMEGLKNSRCFGFGEFPVSVVHLYVMCMFSRLLLLGCLSLYFKDYETCMSRLEIDTFVLVFLLQWKWCLGKEACLCQKRIYGCFRVGLRSSLGYCKITISGLFESLIGCRKWPLNNDTHQQPL